MSGRPEKGYTGQIDDLRVYMRAIGADEIDVLAFDRRVLSILAAASDDRTEAQVDELPDYFLSRHASEGHRRIHRELRALRRDKAAIEETVATTMVMSERDELRLTFVLRRGDYRNQTDVVSPGPPASLPPFDADAPANRLGLARWLVDPAHPLTGRVAVNRYWESLFCHRLGEDARGLRVTGRAAEPP